MGQFLEVKCVQVVCSIEPKESLEVAQILCAGQALMISHLAVTRDKDSYKDRAFHREVSEGLSGQ